MKSLDQIDAAIASVDAKSEKRIPIDATHTPTDGSSVYVIKAAGSYYLTDNLTAPAGLNGISVAADNVSIDLNGFTLTGPGPGGSVAGVICAGVTEGTRVSNGQVTRWPAYGVSVGEDSQVDHVIASNNGIAGIITDNNTTISYCVVRGNSDRGISTNSHCIVSHCLGTRNGTGLLLFGDSVADHCDFSSNDQDGIDLNSGCSVLDSVANKNGVKTSGAGMYGTNGAQGCTIARCIVARNEGYGIVLNALTEVLDCTVVFNTLDGIISSGSCSIDRCLVESNASSTGNGITLGNLSTVTNCTVSSNGSNAHPAAGISTGIRSQVTGCNVNKNFGNGILAQGDSSVRDNHASGNGANGIWTALGSGSSVEGNQTRDNGGTGILASALDVVMRNISGGNTTAQFNPTSGGNFGTLQAPNAATNPFANVSY
jgi:hypothetical protein